MPPSLFDFTQQFVDLVCDVLFKDNFRKTKVLLDKLVGAGMWLRRGGCLIMLKWGSSGQGGVLQYYSVWGWVHAMRCPCPWQCHAIMC